MMPLCLVRVREHFAHLLASPRTVAAGSVSQRPIVCVGLVSGVDLVSSLQVRDGFPISLGEEVEFAELTIRLETPRYLDKGCTQLIFRLTRFAARRPCFGRTGRVFL